MAALLKFAVQKPKGSKWETLALVDDPKTGRREFHDAVGRFGSGYVRLIQVEFRSPDALSDYDWRLIDLHDPFQGKGPRPNLRVISSSTSKAARKTLRAPPRPVGRPVRPVQADEKVPVPVTTYIAAFLFGALALVIWGVWFQV